MAKRKKAAGKRAAKMRKPKAKPKAPARAKPTRRVSTRRVATRLRSARITPAAAAFETTMTALRGGESGGGQVWNRDALVAALENLVTEATRAYERSRRTASDVEQIELLTQRDLAQGALFTAIEEASRANEEALAPIAAGLKAEADAIRGRLQVLRTAVQVVQLLAEVVGVATAIAQRVATSGAPVS